MTLLTLLRNETPYHRALLDTAGRYLEHGQPSDLQVAVVFAQMAVEVRTEQAFEVLCDKVSPAPIAEWVQDRLPSSNLGDPRVLNAYVALSGQRIQDDPPEEPGLWRDFKEHVARRHAVVHEGKRVDKPDAEASLRAARGGIARLQQQVFTP